MPLPICLLHMPTQSYFPYTTHADANSNIPNKKKVWIYYINKQITRTFKTKKASLATNPSTRVFLPLDLPVPPAIKPALRAPVG